MSLNGGMVDLHGYDKATLRRRFLTERNALGDHARATLSAQLVGHLATWLLSRQAAQAFLFLPFKGEPDLTGLIALVPDLIFGLPVIDAAGARTLAFHAWRPGEPLRPNRFGILEPDPVQARQLVPGIDTIVLTPAVAMDRHGYRLGYGGGYYDRFFAVAHDVVGVGVVYSVGLVSRLPREAHDRRLPFLATEHGIQTSQPD